MPSVIQSGFGPIILACKRQLVAQVPILTANPDLVLIIAKNPDKVPHFTGDFDVLLRPAEFISIAAAFDGAGRTCTKCIRVLQMLPRSRRVSDESDRDLIGLTDPAGYFQWEEKCVDAIHGFFPKDNTQNFLTDCEIRIASGQQPEKGLDRDTPDWMRAAIRFDVEYCFTLNQTPWEPPLITNPTVLGFSRGQTVNQVVGVIGGKPPYTFTSFGNLPPNLSFSNGVISGTVSLTDASTGTFFFTVVATDTNQQRASQQFQIVVTSINPTTLPNPIRGVPYIVNLSLIGAPLNPAMPIWIATGLPPGLSINPITGRISGTVNTPGGPGGPFFVHVAIPGWAAADYVLIVKTP